MTGGSESTEGVRLQKALANAGSRRGASPSSSSSRGAYV